MGKKKWTKKEGKMTKEKEEQEERAKGKTDKFIDLPVTYYMVLYHPMYHL